MTWQEHVEAAERLLERGQLQLNMGSPMVTPCVELATGHLEVAWLLLTTEGVGYGRD